MGIIIEPKGVDFLIQSPPLTEEERKEISMYIKSNKKQIKKSKKTIKLKTNAKELVL